MAQFSVTQAPVICPRIFDSFACEFLFLNQELHPTISDMLKGEKHLPIPPPSQGNAGPHRPFNRLC